MDEAFLLDSNRFLLTKNHFSWKSALTDENELESISLSTDPFRLACREMDRYNGCGHSNEVYPLDFVGGESFLLEWEQFLDFMGYCSALVLAGNYLRPHPHIVDCEGESLRSHGLRPLSQER